MRKVNPSKLNEHVDKTLYSTIKIGEVPIPERNEVDVNDIKVNQKSKTKLVKFIERLIRSSFEYREFVAFLRQSAGMDHCAFHKNITNAESFKIKIELHHSPFTLYDITSIIMEKHLIEYEEINPIEVANEVMKLHYQCRVGIIPLSKTVHQMVHNGVIFIPVHLVFGNVDKFVKKYDKYLSAEHKMLLRDHIDLSIEYEKVPDKLKPSYLYLETEGVKPLQEMSLNLTKPQ